MTEWNELMDALLTWYDPSVAQRRMHELQGVALRDATVDDLRALIEAFEDEELEAGVAFAWEHGDLSPYENGGSHSA
ncbi:hypothetical protein D3875_21135 [Deinococcus cavernae]|uniref:Uncharacterized protein n=1 Tax=Deinococcus cavernae TaxID=2320857 RepID=A0A418UZG7_9DEIO|nr:hypothetical protein [Deinococcus cavernae]RJF68867.1 hypothetical protein D3875_21135 [Deinococcus cavernae]